MIVTDYFYEVRKRMSNSDGVYGIKADARLDDNRLYDANDAADGEKVIWGYLSQASNDPSEQST